MSSVFPQWVHDIAAVGAVFGVLITLFLLFEARKLRKSFIRRARLPQVLEELDISTSKLMNSLTKWKVDRKPAWKMIANIKGLLNTTSSKLPNKEQKQIRILLRLIQPKKYYLLKSRISNLTIEDCWNIYIELNSVIAQLNQVEKDSRWD